MPLLHKCTYLTWQVGIVALPGPLLNMCLDDPTPTPSVLHSTFTMRVSHPQVIVFFFFFFYYTNKFILKYTTQC